MHETSLVRALLNQVAELVAAHGGRGAEEVRVRIGPLSGVEPLLVAGAFEQLAPHSVAAGARLVIHEVPLEAECRACSRRFQPQQFRFRCPACQATRVAIVQGDQFQLESVTIEQPEGTVG